tara:strand:+ start:709 stop:1005 length:297 start_codon:yes stop_codon:yes gene_type:complete
MKILAIKLILFYRAVLSPYWPSACRYQPTCSQYAIDVLQTEGLVKGGFLALARLASCGPWIIPREYITGMKYYASKFTVISHHCVSFSDPKVLNKNND